MYALVVVGSWYDIQKEDRTWGEMALKALLKTRTPVVGRGRVKLESILQWGRIEWAVEREAGKSIRRCKQKEKEEGGGNQSNLQASTTTT